MGFYSQQPCWLIVSSLNSERNGPFSTGWKNFSPKLSDSKAPMREKKREGGQTHQRHKSCFKCISQEIWQMSEVKDKQSCPLASDQSASWSWGCALQPASTQGVSEGMPFSNHPNPHRSVRPSWTAVTFISTVILNDLNYSNSQKWVWSLNIQSQHQNKQEILKTHVSLKTSKKVKQSSKLL